MSGLGLKGVDFLAISPAKDLILIEVKNYEDRFPKDDIQPVRAILNDPMAYAKKFAQKFEDSFRLLGIVQQHYQRRWIWPVLEQMGKYFPTSWIGYSDWYFWPQSHRILSETPKKVQLWLWIELGTVVSSREKQQLKTQLIQYLSAYFADSQYQLYLKEKASEEPLAGLIVRSL